MGIAAELLDMGANQTHSGHNRVKGDQYPHDHVRSWAVAFATGNCDQRANVFIRSPSGSAVLHPRFRPHLVPLGENESTA